MSQMLTTILKNLFSKPATRKYPFEKRDPFKNTRGRILFDQAKCDHCGDCERVCPAGAIKVSEKDKQLTYEPFRCIYCWVCVESCMQRAITAEGQYRAPGYEKVSQTYKPTAEPVLK